jgi:nucleoside-diphosphate-sugar epimerase
VPPARVSAERAREVLGWQAEMPFDRGLEELIDGVVAAG